MQGEWKRKENQKEIDLDDKPIGKIVERREDPKLRSPEKKGKEKSVCCADAQSTTVTAAGDRIYSDLGQTQKKESKAKELRPNSGVNELSEEFRSTGHHMGLEMKTKSTKKQYLEINNFTVHEGGGTEKEARGMWEVGFEEGACEPETDKIEFEQELIGTQHNEGLDDSTKDQVASRLKPDSMYHQMGGQGRLEHEGRDTDEINGSAILDSTLVQEQISLGEYYDPISFLNPKEYMQELLNRGVKGGTMINKKGVFEYNNDGN